MIPNFPTLGIRFNIKKIDSASYGVECWKVFWRIVQPQNLRGSILFEGDSAATLNGIENVYCIAIQNIDNSMLKKIRTAMEENPVFLEIAATPKFIEDNHAAAEPLVEAGRIDAGGNLIGDAPNARAALGAVRKEQPIPQNDLSFSIMIPKRTIPSSQRTKHLPMISSIKELLSFLLTNFGEKNKYQFWLTPEELCDLAEHYTHLLQVQWDEDSCALSEDMAYVRLFNKGKTGENITLHGLFPFSTSQSAKEFCYDKSVNFEYLFGQLENLWNIQGRFAINFSGMSHSNWINDDAYKKEKDIDTMDLWSKICTRRARLGLVHL